MPEYSIEIEGQAAVTHKGDAESAVRAVARKVYVGPAYQQRAVNDLAARGHAQGAYGAISWEIRKMRDNPRKPKPWEKPKAPTSAPEGTRWVKRQGAEIKSGMYVLFRRGWKRVDHLSQDRAGRFNLWGMENGNRYLIAEVAEGDWIDTAVPSNPSRANSRKARLKVGGWLEVYPGYSRREDGGRTYVVERTPGGWRARYYGADNENHWLTQDGKWITHNAALHWGSWASEQEAKNAACGMRTNSRRALKIKVKRLHARAKGAADAIRTRGIWIGSPSWDDQRRTRDSLEQQWEKALRRTSGKRNPGLPKGWKVYLAGKDAVEATKDNVLMASRHRGESWVGRHAPNYALPPRAVMIEGNALLDGVKSNPRGFKSFVIAFSPSADKIARVKQIIARWEGKSKADGDLVIGTFRAIDDARKAAAQALDWGIPSRSV